MHSSGIDRELATSCSRFWWNGDLNDQLWSTAKSSLSITKQPSFAPSYDCGNLRFPWGRPSDPLTWIVDRGSQLWVREVSASSNGRSSVVDARQKSFLVWRWPVQGWDNSKFGCRPESRFVLEFWVNQLDSLYCQIECVCISRSSSRLPPYEALSVSIG